MPDLIRAWARRSVPALAIVATLYAATASAQQSLFSFRAPLGAAPSALVRASDGHWYGATRDGGELGHGTLFVLERGMPRVLYTFGGEADGGNPSALVAGDDGALYGLCEVPGGLGLFRAGTTGELQVLQTLATPSGTPLLAAGGGHVYGSDGASTIFEVTSDGQLLKVAALADGRVVSQLALGRDGALYGASPADAAAPAELFRVMPSDGRYQTLAMLAAVSDDSPAEEATALTLNKHGDLLVAARHGESATVYRLDLERGLQALATLATPATQLVAGRHGELYALTSSELLRLAADGGTTRLHAFDARSGSAPGSLVLGRDGLYGTALEGGGGGFGALYRYAAVSGYSTLHSFSYPDGISPTSLVRAADGTLYGTTEGGGEHGFGTVFKASTTGEIETLHAFTGDDGSAPQSLTLGRDGVIYGRTSNGGAGGQGTLFALTSNGSLETWMSFDQSGQGEGPALVQTSDGTLVGADHAGAGHVFRVRADHSYEAVYAFPGLAERDGATPSSLVVGPDDAVYGTTQGAFGPTIPPNYSSGTLFRIDAAGSFSTLYAFNEGDRALGARPSGLVLGADGALYGTSTNIAFLCGTYGSLFKLDPSTRETSLVYAFKGQDDGTGPSSLIQASSGAFYGLTLGGMGIVGADSEDPGVCTTRNSTVFSYAAGALTTLATLPYALSQTEQAADASHVAALTIDADGTLYGVAANGGSAGSGELFAVAPAQE
jgi:uncharacterized repeat protein (TIGR03803 family)